MDGLLSICHDEGIDIQYLALTRSRNVLGWYVPADDDEGDPPTILLDESLPSNRRLHRWVLAEEVGHHWTAPTGSLLGSPHFEAAANSLNRTNRSRDEAKAIRWAARYLMPTMDLAQAARAGCHTVHELAEWFDVPEWMVHRRKRILRDDLRKRQGLRVSVRDLFLPVLVDNLWWIEPRVVNDAYHEDTRSNPRNRRKAVSTF